MEELWKQNTDKTPLYGVMDAVSEEMSELNKAMIKYKRSQHCGLPTPVTTEEATAMIKEELSQVLTCIKCLIYKMDIDTEEIYQYQLEGDQKIADRYKQLEEETSNG